MMRHWRILFLSAVLVVAACASKRTTFLPDGERAYAISCKGFLDSWQTCLIKAGRICGASGYQAIRSEEYDREMLIACQTRASD
jgi:hypothetical protein